MRFSLPILLALGLAFSVHANKLEIDFDSSIDAGAVLDGISGKDGRSQEVAPQVGKSGSCLPFVDEIEFVAPNSKAIQTVCGRGFERLPPASISGGEMSYKAQVSYYALVGDKSSESAVMDFFDRSEIVLTNAFVKKTRKTPAAEIERAISREGPCPAVLAVKE